MKGQPVDVAINLERVVQARQAIKDARTAKRHVWEKADLELEEDQKKLDMLMLDFLNRTGSSSIKTTAGTVIRSERLKPSAADWGAINQWVKENDAFDIYEKRLKAAFIKEYMDEHGGALPPGVNAHREYEVSVRRPANSSSTTDDE